MDQRHFSCEIAGVEARPDCTVCLFYLFFFYKGGVDAQKLPKCTANICTDLVFDGL